MSATPFARHDHGSCVKTGMQSCEAYCTDHGLRLTPVRRRVLELLLSEHRAWGAYEILEVLRRENRGGQPPVAYRALEFLVDCGFAHRVEKLNAFVACTSPQENHSPTFFICRSCHRVAEEATARPLVNAEYPGFIAESAVIEVEGQCADCAGGNAV